MNKDVAYLNEINLKNPFGVLEFLHWNHSWNSYKYSSNRDLEKVVSLMAEAGVGWVRVDFLWQDIEPQKGSFDFAKYDYIVQLLRSKGMHILGILHYSTDWSSACGQWNCPPKDNKVFVNYASKVIQRYKGQVKYWEVWNEPDSATYWKEQDGLKSYCVLLREVYKAAKQIDPECKILNGGLANGISSVNLLYDNGAKDYFDILNIHFFQTPLSNGAIKAVASYPRLAHKIMQRNGDGDKKIWITEFGYPTDGCYSWDGYCDPTLSEENQNIRISNIFQTLRENYSYVTGFFWYDYMDDCESGNPLDTECRFGLVRTDLSKKPAYYTYQNLSSSLPIVPKNISTNKTAINNPITNSTTQTTNISTNQTINSSTNNTSTAKTSEAPSSTTSAISSSSSGGAVAEIPENTSSEPIPEQTTPSSTTNYTTAQHILRITIQTTPSTQPWAGLHKGIITRIS
ncbi:MAG: endo-1,4-beta-xylanase [bacterium]